MAGGIFPNYPFQLNIKCVIFSFIIISLFFYKPPELDIIWKFYISIILFIISYIAMAWYDYKFQCQKLALKRGTNDKSLTQIIKPPMHTKSQKDMSQATKEENFLEQNLLHAYHAFIVSPLLIFIGTYKNNTSENVFLLLNISLFFVILYHLPRILRKFNFISFGHIIMTLAIAIITIKKNKPNWFFELLSGLGIYAGVKHSFYIIKNYKLFL